MKLKTTSDACFRKMERDDAFLVGNTTPITGPHFIIEGSEEPFGDYTEEQREWTHSVWGEEIETAKPLFFKTMKDARKGKKILEQVFEAAAFEYRIVPSVTK